MSSLIAKTAFSLKPCNEKSYNYTTSFMDSAGQVVSEKTTTFQIQPLSSGSCNRILDVYSQNGKCTSGSKGNVTDGSIFGEEDRRAMARTVKKMGKIQEAVTTLVGEDVQISPSSLYDRVILVLDLRDEKDNYDNGSLIKQTEEEVGNYLKNPLEIPASLSQSTPVSPESPLGMSDNPSLTSETLVSPTVLDTAVCSPASPPTPMKLLRRSNYLANTIHRICQKALSVDDIFCEGSLKVQLMKNLSDDQKDYFAKNPKEFCEYTEPYITAFKLGHTVEHIPNPEQFFMNISGRGTFRPGSMSTTWYPKSYIKLYGPNGRIPAAMKDVFSISSKEDPICKIFSTTVKGNKI